MYCECMTPSTSGAHAKSQAGSSLPNIPHDHEQKRKLLTITGKSQMGAQDFEHGIELLHCIATQDSDGIRKVVQRYMDDLRSTNKTDYCKYEGKSYYEVLQERVNNATTDEEVCALNFRSTDLDGFATVTRVEVLDDFLPVITWCISQYLYHTIT
jgi:hypothetical protein